MPHPTDPAGSGIIPIPRENRTCPWQAVLTSGIRPDADLCCRSITTGLVNPGIWADPGVQADEQLQAGWHPVTT
jgi:hypothetical protein